MEDFKTISKFYMDESTLDRIHPYECAEIVSTFFLLAQGPFFRTVEAESGKYLVKRYTDGSFLIGRAEAPFLELHPVELVHMGEVVGNGCTGDALGLVRTRSKPAAPVRNQAPPLNAQWLVDLFLDDDAYETRIGDLQERYGTKLARLGKKRADIWYWKQVLASLLPLARAAGGRVSRRTICRAFCFVLRLLGQGHMADALQKALDEPPRKGVGG